MNHAGRNDPCPCGSGKKFKKCCMAEKKEYAPVPDNVASALAMGYKSMSTENWQEAIDHFKSILDDAPKKDELYEAIASCYEGQEEFLRASEFYEKAITMAPDSRKPTLIYRLAIARGLAGRLDKAIEALKELIQLGYSSEGEDLIGERSRWTDLLNIFEQIKKGERHKDFLMVNVQLQRAFNDMETENFGLAETRLRRIAAIEPDNDVIFYNLGVVLAMQKKEDQALEMFQRCVDLNPMYAASWYNMGQIHLITKKDYSGALHCFTKASKARPDYVGAHHQMGVAYELIGDKKRAAASWKKTLELDPGNAQATQNLKRLEESQ